MTATTSSAAWLFQVAARGCLHPRWCSAVVPGTGRSGQVQGTSLGKGGLLGCAKAVPVRTRARASPRQEKALAKRHDARDAGLSRQQFPRHCRMFMARLHRRALAFLGFWVRQAPRRTPRIVWRRGSLHYQIASHQGWIGVNLRTQAGVARCRRLIAIACVRIRCAYATNHLNSPGLDARHCTSQLARHS